MTDTIALSCRPRRLDILLLSGVLLYAVAIRGLLLNVPFSRNTEGVGCYYGLLARNYFRYDWRLTLGVPVQNVGQLAGTGPTFYANHPPGVPLLIAAVYGALGRPAQADWHPSDWQTRLATAGFTIGCVMTIYLLLRQQGQSRAGLIAAFIFCFAADDDSARWAARLHRAAAGLLWRCSLWGRTCVSTSARGSTVGTASAGVAPAAAMDWPAFYLVPVLGVHFLSMRRGEIGDGWLHLSWRRRRCFCWPTARLPALRTTGSGWREHLLRRAWGPTPMTIRRSPSGGGGPRLGSTMCLLIPSLYCCSAGLGWAYGAGGGSKEHGAASVLTGGVAPVRVNAAGEATGGTLRYGATVVWLLLGWALLHIAIGQQGVLVHEWWWWPLTPGLAMAAGMMLEEVCLLGERFVLGPIATATTLLLLLAFTVWTARSTVPVFLIRGGCTTRSNTALWRWGRRLPPPRPGLIGLVLACDDIYEAQLWYYGQRPLSLACGMPEHWTGACGMG